MNFKKLPKQEEVTEIDLGQLKASIVELTDENRPHVLEAVLSMYMDDECMYCHRNFSYEEVKKSVRAYENPYGRIVHKECWDANN
jgi:hypothetical protein